MSDTYDHKGVTVTPQPGGYYELAHPSLTEAERVRGKEKADQRADEIALAAASDDDGGRIDPQGDLGAAPPPLLIEPVANFAPSEVPSTANDPAVALILEQNAAMHTQMQAMQARMEELAAAGVRTVGQTEGAMPPRVAMPSHFAGEMDADTRARLEEKGHKVVKIILEENETIPPTGLFVSHNGRPYMIQPGIPVELPDFLVSILDDAVMSTPIVNTESKKVVGYRDRLKYAYRRVE